MILLAELCVYCKYQAVTYEDEKHTNVFIISVCQYKHTTHLSHPKQEYVTIVF